jgi:predicted enzyme related to lactoylglutathione lyase
MPNPLYQFDIVVDGSKKQTCKNFYKNVFSWNFEYPNVPGPSYESIIMEDDPQGGLGSLPIEKPSFLIAFFKVNNLNQIRNLANTNNATSVSDIKVHPRGGQYFTFKDPAGILVGAYQEET